MQLSVIRSLGGWGDVQMALGAITAYKKEHPTSDIHFTVEENLTDLTKHNPYLATVTSVPSGIVLEGTNAISINRVCLDYETSRANSKVRLNRMELFAKAIGVKHYRTSKNFFPSVFVANQELEKAEELLKHSPRPRAFLVTKSFSWSRDWDPHSKWYELSHMLRKQGWSIIVSRARRMEWEDMDWRNCQLLVQQPIRTIIATLSQCDLVIGVDTGPMHTAASLGIPTVWIFTCTDGKVRTKNYANAKYVHGDCPNYPCWYSLKCAYRKFGLVCSRSITPEQVLSAIRGLDVTS